jgi:hypothetical protein
MNDNIRTIRLNRLVPHPDNANRMSRANFAKLIRNIERAGHYEPLVVRPHPNQTGKFQIINGQHRCEALRQLGRKTAQAVVWNMDDEQADILLTTLNRLSGRDMLEKKLNVLRRLCRVIPLHDLAKLVPQTQGQLQRLMSRKLNPAKVQIRQPLHAIPLVFFVDEAQQRLIEDALASVPAPVSKTTRATQRAAALSHLAACFASHGES